MKTYLCAEYYVKAKSYIPEVYVHNDIVSLHSIAHQWYSTVPFFMAGSNDLHQVSIISYP